MDRPILFSAPMVRALLEGRKTQTRRVLKPQPNGDVIHYGWQSEGGAFWTDQHFESHRLRIWAGDRLWVREACCIHGDEVFYRANEPGVTVGLGGFAKWRPGIHMPRWASRLTLTVTDVRVQRLQDISEEDAVAEGIDMHSDHAELCKSVADSSWPNDMPRGSPEIAVYRSLWDSINGVGSWEANPWVAAYTFTVERRNIDARSSSVEG